MAVKGDIFKDREQPVLLYPAADAAIGESWETETPGEPVSIRALVKHGNGSLSADTAASEQPTTAEISAFFDGATAEAVRGRLVVGGRLTTDSRDYVISAVDADATLPVRRYACKIIARRAD